jgi:hypothetical protein
MGNPKKKTLKLTITVTEYAVAQADGTIPTSVKFTFTPSINNNERSVRGAICMAAIQGVQKFFDDQKMLPTGLKMKPKKGGR